MNERVGTVTDPIWNGVLTALFIGFGLVLIVAAVGSLIMQGVREHRRRRAEQQSRSTRLGWVLDDETPIGNQLLGEYLGGVR